MKSFVQTIAFLLTLRGLLVGTLRKALSFHTAPETWATWEIITTAYGEYYVGLVCNCITDEMYDNFVEQVRNQS